jgi:hypothetical protein
MPAPEATSKAPKVYIAIYGKDESIASKGAISLGGIGFLFECE